MGHLFWMVYISSSLPHAEEKLIAVITYLGCSNDPNNLIMRDCPSTQKKPQSMVLKAWNENRDKY